MKKISRTKCARLAEKLLEIRLALGLSQSEILVRLGFDDELFRSNVSQYERGERQPPLPVLLMYARVAGVPVDVLIDDELRLPAKLPHKSKQTGKTLLNDDEERETTILSQYTLEDLKQLAAEALENLPDGAKDDNKTIDEKRTVALKQLFLTIRRDAEASPEIHNSEFEKMSPVQREAAKITKYLNVEGNLHGEGISWVIADYLKQAVPNTLDEDRTNTAD